MEVLKKYGSQEAIVFALFVLAFVSFSFALPGFLTVGNLLNLIRNSSVLGILGIGMAIAIIGRGIDLTVIANMVISVGLTLYLVGQGISTPVALGCGLLFALACGLASGFLVAYVEIPALFATLAFGACIYGFGRAFLIPNEVVPLPDNNGWLAAFGKGAVFEIPTPVFYFAGIAILAALMLTFTKLGAYIYGLGENYACARLTGLPIRIIIVLQYALSGVITFLAGAVLAASSSGIQTRLFNSTMLYDVILVAVLGGVGLSGGKGGIRNVLVGSLLVACLVNGMTIMDVSLTIQNIVKGIMLIVAILIDSVVNPRDEQVAQQGDI